MSRQVGDHRIYDVPHPTNEGELIPYPSVTTILQALPESSGLEWFKRNHPDPEGWKNYRAMIGSTCHYYFECQMAKHLPDHTPEMEDIPFKQWYNYQDNTAEIIGNINRKIELFLQLHEFEPLYLETPLHSHKYKVAGRVDYIGYVDGIPAIVDLKTAKKLYPPENGFSKFAIQLTAYMEAAKETLDLDIEKLFILRVNENNTPEMKEYAPDFDALEYTRNEFRHRFGF